VASFNPDKGDSAFPMELAKPLLINDAIVLFMPIGNGAQTQLDFNSKDIEVWSLAKAGALLILMFVCDYCFDCIFGFSCVVDRFYANVCASILCTTHN
jgi:hypothetical protein